MQFRHFFCVALMLPSCGLLSPVAAPTDRFYFPSGIVHTPVSGSTEGVLVVANNNNDRRFPTGSMMAVKLDDVGLPAFGAPVATSGPERLSALKVKDAGRVLLSSFAGQLALWPLGPDRGRLFIPSQSEGSHLQSIDFEWSGGEAKLSCFNGDVANRDCGKDSPSLDANQNSATGVPRAPAPYGVAIQPRRCQVASDCSGSDGQDNQCVEGLCKSKDGAEAIGSVMVTHLLQADSPRSTGNAFRAYVVKVDTNAKQVTDDNFVEVGNGASDSIAVGSRWNFVSGRFLSNGFYSTPRLIRLLDKLNLPLLTTVIDSYRVAEGAGIALSKDEKRLYLASRSPDALLVFNVEDAQADDPKISLVRQVPMPSGPNRVVVIPRGNDGELVAVSCSDAGSLVLYDDRVGTIAAEVPSLGLRPFGLAVAPQAAGARIYISNFIDGRISVVDVPDLNRPQGARKVAYIGASQLCLTQGLSQPDCEVGSAP